MMNNVKLLVLFLFFNSCSLLLPASLMAAGTPINENGKRPSTDIVIRNLSKKSGITDIVFSAIPSNSLIFVSNDYLLNIVQQWCHQQDSVCVVDPRLLDSPSYREELKRKCGISIELTAETSTNWAQIMYELFMQTSFTKYFLIEDKAIVWTYSYMYLDGYVPELSKRKCGSSNVGTEEAWVRLFGLLVHNPGLQREDARLISVLRMISGSLYYIQGAKDLAWLAYRDADIFDPTNGEVLVRLTDYLVREKRYAEAEKVINGRLVDVDRALAERIRDALNTSKDYEHWKKGMEGTSQKTTNEMGFHEVGGDRP